MIHPCEKGYHLLLNLTRDRRAISSSSLDLGRALYFFGFFFWGGDASMDGLMKVGALGGRFDLPSSSGKNAIPLP